MKAYDFRRIISDCDTDLGNCAIVNYWASVEITSELTKEISAYTPRLRSSNDDLISALKAVRSFAEDEVEQRGLAGSDMSDYQDEAFNALAIIDAAITKAEVVK